MTSIFSKCFVEVVNVVDKEGDLPKLQERKIWPPRRIVEELSDISLMQLCKKLEEDYISVSSLPGKLIGDCFQLLNKKMRKSVREVINPNDHGAWKRWSNMLDNLVGEINLRDYYGETPEDNIADWSYRVFRRVRTYVTEKNWLERPFEDLLEEICHENYR
ncbi:MAG: hypothetical protein Q8M92_08545 [Candidatus Subteraquimicrobiales bacterium]|nr:hypothetical protein [Candidatus Subteraquimicrobiales bacterium]